MVVHLNYTDTRPNKTGPHGPN